MQAPHPLRVEVRRQLALHGLRLQDEAQPMSARRCIHRPWKHPCHTPLLLNESHADTGGENLLHEKLLNSDRGENLKDFNGFHEREELECPRSTHQNDVKNLALGGNLED